MTLADDLERLQQLRTAGTLTEEEFQQAKARLLGAPAAPPALPPRDLEREARQWACFLHLSLYAHAVVPLGGIVVPLVLWQLKKDEYPLVDAHGKHVLNWAISMAIYFAVAIPLCFVLVGIPAVILLAVAGFVCPLIGALKANNGELWTYPGAIPFLG
jgi:hypothetical protein